MFRRHPNNIGFHFSLPWFPHLVVWLDAVLIRVRLFLPFYLSLSMGLLGYKGLQLGFGLKYDPTEYLKWGEPDYLFSAHARYHKLGTSDETDRMASY